MPSVFADRSTSPPVAAKVRSTSWRRASATLDPTAIVTADGISPYWRRWRGLTSLALIRGPRDMMTARSIAFFSSRTLPGQW